MFQYSPFPPLVGSSASAAPYRFGQPTYTSIFRADEERPVIDTTRRWWEGTATALLSSNNPQELKRVIRYGLYPTEQHCRFVLQKRNPFVISDFLRQLVLPQDGPHYARLPIEQKVQEFMKRCKLPTPPVMTWGWLPTPKNDDLDPLALAEAIDTESHVHFIRITFEDMVQYSLGYPSKRVDWFLDQHSCFHAHLLDYFSAFPGEMARYAEVEKHLRSRSPFAHRAVVCALQSAGFPLELPSTRQPGFTFFAEPIQRLFKQIKDFQMIIKVLCVLGVRFERTYLHSRQMNWSDSFSISFSFLEDVLNSCSSSDFAHSSVTEFAEELTASDERDFAALIEEETLDEDRANRLSRRWELLSNDVWECCRALPDIIHFVQQSFQHLLKLRNYHSLTAILSGLHKYNVTEAMSMRLGGGNTALSLKENLAPEFEFLLDPSHNFLAYRERYQQAPGVPFLAPHLIESSYNGAPILQQLHWQLRAVIPRR